MKKTFAILVASTAVAIGTGIPAWSGMHRAEHASARTDDDGILKLASDDRGGRVREGGAAGRTDPPAAGSRGFGVAAEEPAAPAPRSSPTPAAGRPAAPPANGLFGSGAAPKVKLN